MNYLALIGWSPRRADEELLPIDELARRFSLEDVGPQRGRVRRGEARVGQPPLSEDGRSGAARRSVGAVLQRRRRVDGADRRGARLPRVGDADGQRVGRSARPRCRRGWRSCSTTIADAALPTSRRSRRRCAQTARARSCARWPRNWRPRRGSIASDSARSANQRQGAHGPEGQGAVSSDPRRADRAGRGAGARSGGAGDRSRRGAAARRRRAADCRHAASARPRSRARSERCVMTSVPMPMP